MRVTESSLIDLAQRGVSKARERAAQAGETLSDGLRVRRPSDDPAAWAEGMRSSARLVFSEAHGSAIARESEQLRDSDAFLSRVGDALSRASELTIELTNPIYGAGERAAGATELRGMIESLQGADANVLATFDRIALALENNDAAAARIELDALRDGTDQNAAARSELGSRMRTLESAEVARQDLELALEQKRADAVGADAISGAIELAASAGALQGARTAAEQIIALATRR
jgi:flagellin-like hook-associated protein FlgL